MLTNFRLYILILWVFCLQHCFKRIDLIQGKTLIWNCIDALQNVENPATIINIVDDQPPAFF